MRKVVSLYDTVLSYTWQLCQTVDRTQWQSRDSCCGCVHMNCTIQYNTDNNGAIFTGIHAIMRYLECIIYNHKLIDYVYTIRIANGGV